MPKKPTPIQKDQLKKLEEELRKQKEEELISRRRKLEEQIQQYKEYLKEAYCSLTAEEQETIRKNYALIPDLEKKQQSIFSLRLEKYKELEKINPALEPFKKLVRFRTIDPKKLHDEVLEKWKEYTADTCFAMDPFSSDSFHEVKITPQIPQDWDKSYFTEMWNLFISRDGNNDEISSLENKISSLNEEIKLLMNEERKIDSEINKPKYISASIKFEKKRSYERALNTDAEYAKLVQELHDVEENVTEKYYWLIKDLWAHPKKHLKPAAGFFMDD